MRILNQQELRFMEQFFQVSQGSLVKAMAKYLTDKYTEVKATDKYIMAVGDIPVALVAHLDTVFGKPTSNIYYDRSKNVMWSPEGLGADDRAGVYAIIQIIKSGLRPTVIFTTDEELGALGADKLVKDIPKPNCELKYIIELDRRGSNDCVFYDCYNMDFEAYIESFGFVTNFGSFSDISVICPEWGVAGVNLSIGYYNEHSISETLHIGQMFETIKRVKTMLKDAENCDEFEYIEAPYLKKKTSVTKYDEWYDWDPSYGISKEEWSRLMSPQIKCHDCEIWEFDYNLFPVKTKDKDKTLYLCSDCFIKRDDVIWCDKCQEPFLLYEDADFIVQLVFCVSRKFG